MQKIEVTQFIPPDGRTQSVTMLMPNDYAAKAGAVHRSGCRLTVERLSTDQISLCIEDPNIGDFDIEICEEGPAIREAIYAMLDRFDEAKLKKWRKQCST